MASALPVDNFVPSTIRRWLLPNQPLDFFRAFDQDYFACADGIYHLNQDSSSDDLIEDMDTEDDSPDLFGVSDIDMESKTGEIKDERKTAQLVYKYKKPALAFSFLSQDDETCLLFSLHRKRQLGVTQTQSQSSCSSFYIECTSLQGNTFNCKKPNVALLDCKPDLPDGPVSEQQDKTGQSWILVVNADRVTSHFFQLASIKAKVNRTDVVVLFHVNDDPGKLHIAVLNSSKNLETLNSLCRLVEFDASQKINILLNENIFQSLIPDSEETLDTAKDKIEFVLSKQPSSVDHLDGVYKRSDIAEVVACLSGALILFKSGALWQYRKIGRDIVKTSLPVLHVAKIFCKNDLLSVVSRSGMIYRFQLPYVHSNPELTGNSQDGLEDYLRATEALKAATLVRLEKQEMLEQIRFCLSLDNFQPSSVGVGDSPTHPLNVVIRVSIRQLNLSDEPAYNLEVKLKQRDGSKKIPLRGKFWHLITTIAAKRDQDRTLIYQTAPLPGVLNENVAEWISIQPIHESLLHPDQFPLVVNVRLCLTIAKQSVKSSLLLEEELTLIDFLSVKTVTKNSRCLLQNATNYDCHRDVTGPSESLEHFLEKLNQARAVTDVFESEEKVLSLFNRHPMASFQIELKKGFLEAHQSKPLFAKLVDIIFGSGQHPFQDDLALLAFIFGTEIFIVVTEAENGHVWLAFKSKNRSLLLSLKNDLNNLKLKELQNSGKVHVSISISLIRHLDDLKCFMDSIGSEATEQNCEALNACYKFLRQEISSKLP